MTTPCVNANHFQHSDGELTVASRSIQNRRLLSDSRPGMIRSYSATPGVAPGDQLVLMDGLTALQTDLTATQRLMAIITLDYAQVEWRSRTVGTIIVRAGMTVGTGGGPPALPSFTTLSTFGGGCNLGPATGNANYGQYTDRGGPFRMILPTFPTLVVGNQIRYRVDVRAVAENWDASTINGGTAESQNRVELGETRIDIYAAPLPIFFP